MENARQISLESDEQGIASIGEGHACDSVFVTGCAVSLGLLWACH
jgi:hypothetical protein